jgi:hypothetical protein
MPLFYLYFYDTLLVTHFEHLLCPTIYLFILDNHHSMTVVMPSSIITLHIQMHLALSFTSSIMYIVF